MRIPQLHTLGLIGGATVSLTAPAFAEQYLTVEQAQTILCRGQSLKALDLTLTDAQAKQIEALSGDKVRERTLKVWRMGNHGVFFVDHVPGKNETITYAAAFDATGKVLGVEILDYRETYGGQIRNDKWRGQFAGKSVRAGQIEFDKDIKNISGATISCRNVTRGMRRLSVTFDLVIRPLAP